MAYVNVPKDLTKIKSKVLFNLTKRQLICFGLAALMGVPLFFLLKGGIGTTAAAMVMIVVMKAAFCAPRSAPIRPSTHTTPLCVNIKWNRR